MVFIYFSRYKFRCSVTEIMRNRNEIQATEELLMNKHLFQKFYYSEFTLDNAESHQNIGLALITMN